MNVAKQLSAAARCSACGQRLDRNPGGRPVVFDSRRQRILALLDEVGRADTRKINEVIGADIKKLRCTLHELKTEEKIRKVGKVGRAVLWELNDFDCVTGGHKHYLDMSIKESAEALDVAIDQAMEDM